jgi:hypothetical protein
VNGRTVSPRHSSFKGIRASCNFRPSMERWPFAITVGSKYVKRCHSQFEFVKASINRFHTSADT